MILSAYDYDGRRKYLSVPEGLRFLAAADVMPLADRTLCRVLHFSGCRISEILELEPGRIDFAEGVLRVRTLKQRTKVKTRRIPLPPDLVSSLQELRSDNELYWRYSRTTAWRIVKVVMMLAEIEGIHACPKGLRHGFGVRAALAGVPITKIQAWMGHSKVETTAIYLDTRDEEDRELMARTWTER